ncbi:hypothetical protein [Pseudosulfitobacter pseudonitzschiae]|uniref:hypothetical protein n=1 Tax=Pseudosulfitobacter pseudonitzschiae TaxID=1402135 RepID=UPI003B7E98EF
MTTAKTTETLLRQRDFTFNETRKTDHGEVDIYSADTSTQIHVIYDLEGVPTDIKLCAPAHDIDEVIIIAASDRPLVEDARETLLYELIDGAQLMFRMSGVTEDQPDPDMA